MAQATAGSPRTSVRHPLAPLTPGEAGLASRLALAAAGAGSRLVYCALAEPAKRAVLAWDGRPLPREARCVLYQRPAGQTWVVTVSLDDAAVTRTVLVPDVQPPLMAEEWMANGDQIKADPGFRAALGRRGITDMSMIQVDPWPASNFGLEVDASGRRLALGVAYLLDGPGSNPYGRPRTWWPCWIATPERCWRSRTASWCPSPGTPAGTTRPASGNSARWRPCI